MLNVFLDTNIYRALGLRFAKHRDYDYLRKFLDLSGNELGMIYVVERELLDYYKKDVFSKLFANYSRAVRNINDNPYLAKLPTADFSNIEDEAFKRLSSEMSTSMKLHIEDVPTDLLTSFLLDNKAERRGDNARDFLIFYSLMIACQDAPDEIFVLISKDRIFQDNTFFRSQIKENSIGNLRVYESIPAFLSEAGPKVDWLTGEMITAKIDTAVIMEELSNDVTCLPSYISKYYLGKDGDDLPIIEELKINSYRLVNFYVHSNPESGALMVNADVAVSVYALFGPSPDPESLRAFLEQRSAPTIETPEKFDNQGRLIYDEDVLFLFEGRIDQENKSVVNFQFVDFFPSYFRYDNFQLGPAYRLLPMDPIKYLG